MLNTPFLIQRCRVKKDVEPKAGQKFSDRISLEYMGSSEFEDGSVARSLARLADKNLTVSTHEGLKVLTTDLEAMPYKGILSDLKNRKIHTKEYVFSSNEETDLWIDLDNDVIFTTNEEILTELEALLQNSQKEILRRREVKKVADEIHRTQDLGALNKVLPGRCLLLVHHELGDCQATQNMDTKFPIAYYLNDAGGWSSDFDLSGFYTVEEIQQYIKTQTGKMQDRLETSKRLKLQAQEKRRREHEAETKKKKEKREATKKKRKL